MTNTPPASPILPEEEYVEQAFFYRSLAQRMEVDQSVQDSIQQIREEVLATTKLPMAIDFINDELNHTGIMSSAMRKLAHYFNPFQTYLISEAERDYGKFNIVTALAILEKDAMGKAEKRSPQATFFFQFESICRNSLQYDYGLSAVAYDPTFDESWRQWILDIRRKIGTVTLADLVYVHSEHYLQQQSRLGRESFDGPELILFGVNEGKIALANRRKDALFFFSALQRQLKYPPVPRVEKRDENVDLVPKLIRHVDRLEARLKFLEDEQRDKGIDLSKYYQKPDHGAGESI